MLESLFCRIVVSSLRFSRFGKEYFCPNSVKAASIALAEEYADVILLGNKEKINNMAKENEIVLFETNIDKIHTTAMGMDRIKKNLSLYEADVVEWCKSKIMSEKAEISRQGKNWYICIEGCIITVNASSYTIITAHKEKR